MAIHSTLNRFAIFGRMIFAFDDKEPTMKFIPYAVLILLGQLNICMGQTTNHSDPNSTEVIAVVLGEEITAANKNRLSGIILRSLFNKYAKDRAIGPNDVEISDFTKRLDEISKQQHVKLIKRCALLRKDLESTSLGDEGGTKGVMP